MLKSHFGFVLSVDIHDFFSHETLANMTKSEKKKKKKMKLFVTCRPVIPDEKNAAPNASFGFVVLKKSITTSINHFETCLAYLYFNYHFYTFLSFSLELLIERTHSVCLPSSDVNNPNQQVVYNQQMSRHIGKPTI